MLELGRQQEQALETAASVSAVASCPKPDAAVSRKAEDVYIIHPSWSFTLVQAFL